MKRLTEHARTTEQKNLIYVSFFALSWFYWCKSKLFLPNEIFSLDCFRGRQVHWTETTVNSFYPFVLALFICVGAVQMGRDEDKTLGAWNGAASGKIRDGHMELLLLWLFRFEYSSAPNDLRASSMCDRVLCVWMWDRASQPIISCEIYEFIPSTLPSWDLFLLRSIGERRPPHNQRHRCTMCRWRTSCSFILALFSFQFASLRTLLCVCHKSDKKCWFMRLKINFRPPK